MYNKCFSFVIREKLVKAVLSPLIQNMETPHRSRISMLCPDFASVSAVFREHVQCESNSTR